MPNKKQKLISEFFSKKSEKSQPSPLKTSTEKTTNTSCTDEISIVNNENGKRQLDNISEDNNNVNDSFIDINYIDFQLFEATLEEDINDIEIIEDNDTQKVSSIFKVYETFRNILKKIITDPHFEYLFDENDWSVIHDFTSLSGPVQVLYIKLYMRQRNWIKVTHIDYPEIKNETQNCDHRKELETLCSHKFLVDASNFQSIEEGLNAMFLYDLKVFIKPFINFSRFNYSNKDKVILSFLNHVKESRSVDNQSLDNYILNRLRNFAKNKYVKIHEDKSSLFDRIFLLYHCPNFLFDKNVDNWHSGILGEYTIKNEDYPVQETNKVAILYSSRDELIEFSQAFNYLCEITVLFNNKKFQEIHDIYLPQIHIKFEECFQEWSEKDSKLDGFLRQYTATGMYVRCFHQCLNSLEKLRKYNEYLELACGLLSQEIYGEQYRPHWHLRGSLIGQSHLKNFLICEQWCVDGMDDPSVKFHHRLELYSRLKNLWRKPKIEFFSRNIAFDVDPDLKYQEIEVFADYRNIQNETNRKNFFFETHSNGDEEILSVEEVVKRKFRKLGYPNGIHCESSLYLNLFVLFFWDIIYSLDQADSFRYQNQIFPLDLKSDSFYRRRTDLIAKRIDEISNFNESDFENELKKSWEKNYKKASLLVEWDRYSLSQLTEIGLCFTPKKLVKIFDLLAKNYRHLRKGFPDLLVWNFEARKIKVIEVKGPTDKISPIQSIWLSTLTNFEIDAVLCHVKPNRKNA